MKKPAILHLENGHTFKGYSFGASGSTEGELCFNTSMTGYQEILTDPSYAGQLVTMTSPHIGNYGVNPEDMESTRIQAAGFIVREASPIHSNYRATQSLQEFLSDSGIVGIQGIDTRSLTRILRNEGAMNGVISSDEFDPDNLKEMVANVPQMSGQNLASRVSCTEAWEYEGQTDTRFHVVVLDLGVKQNILRLLNQHGCALTVMPADTPANEIMAMTPDGVFLSNGPGDPSAVHAAIKTVEALAGKVPLFGICLGHQILSLALGASTYKLKFGHRGANHPVRNELKGTVEITSQNHGFAVDPTSLPESVKVTHVNLNDGTMEGLACDHIPAFSVQYHPEASPGPHDSRYLFADFIRLMEAHAQTN